MATITRKQRERKERERMFIGIARHYIVRDGYLGFSMDQVAEEAEYSKGTLYQHFSTKEDLILAVLSESIKERSRLFQRALAFEGKTRERFTAVGVADEIFAYAYSEHFQMEHLVRTTSLWEKTSEKRQIEFGEEYHTCFKIALRTIEEAVEKNELSNSQVTPRQVLHAMRAMSLGTHILVSTGKKEAAWYEEDLYTLFRRNAQLYLDGIRWYPLSIDWDYDKTLERIKHEVFADEFAT